MGKTMQLALLILLVISVGAVGIRFFFKKNENENVKVKLSKNSFEEEKPEAAKEKKNNKEQDNNKQFSQDMDGKKEINEISLHEMKMMGVNAKVAVSIINYRERFGCIRKIEDIDNVKGVGAKTYEKIKELFYVDEEKVKKLPLAKININAIEDKETLYFLGLTKKEAEKIEKWKKERGSVFSNIELLTILGEEKYNAVKDMVYYSEYK